MLPQCFLASSAIDAESNELAMSTASDDRSWPSARQSTQQAGVHLLQSPLESKTLVFSPWVSPLSNPSPIHRNKTQKKKNEKRYGKTGVFQQHQGHLWSTSSVPKVNENSPTRLAGILCNLASKWSNAVQKILSQFWWWSVLVQNPVACLHVKNSKIVSSHAVSCQMNLHTSV